MSKKITTKKMKLLAQATVKVVQSTTVNTIIPAGIASTGPPLGPLLGQRGINVAAFCKDFNNRTSLFREGVPLPCQIKVKADRSYDLRINHPTETYFLMQAAGIQRGCMDSENPELTPCGMITIKHIYEIAKLKQQDYYYQLTPLKELVEKLVVQCHHTGIKVVRDLDPVEYKVFLEERKKIVDAQLAKLQTQRDEKMLRK